MAWTYSGNPASSPRDEVRFLSGDNTESTPFVTDDEIAYLLGKHSPQVAAAHVADAISAAFALKADKTVGSLSISYSSRATAAADLATRLRTNASTTRVGAPVLGGGGLTYLGPASRPDFAPINGA